MTHLFGTNGIRWIIDDHSIDYPVKLGLVAGTYFAPGNKVALGMDTRTSGPMIFNAMLSGLESCGCDVIDLGILPTPTFQYAVKELGIAGGIIVTASHNPPEFNGLKFIASDGTEFSKEQEATVEKIFNENAMKNVPWNQIGKQYRERHVQDRYRNSIISKAKLGDNHVRTVVDCGNGTSWEYTPGILTKLKCEVLTLNAQPDGRFPGRLPEPTEDNVGSLMMAVKQHGSDIGIAHDGDADRAAFVDDNGKFITGDQSLALFAVDALKKHGSGKVVVPVNTSMTVLDVVEENGGEAIITPVGSPLIARKMMEIKAILGGEGNGGVIFPDHLYCRDGMMTAVRMVEIISHNGPVSELIAQLPEYFLRRDKIRIPHGMRNDIISRVKSDAPGEILDIDGIKIDHDDHWILIRPSGTEPILRVTVESKSEEQCKNILADNLNWVREIIKDLS
ncbi:MAG: phosphoglucosamine mutase [Thermoplasmata archaeon]|nr:phosphoglucosamine mutase [Thermoplasmata archaeon]